jgi:hypothetical protein
MSSSILYRNLKEPIPNEPFSAEEKYFVQSPQGPLPVGDGLEIDPETGEISAN